MASQSFTLQAGATEASGTIAVAAGMAVRVRFSSFPGGKFGNPIVPFLEIVANAVTTIHLIDTPDGWICEGVAEGDVVRVVPNFKGDDTEIVGIIEEIAR